MSDYKVPERAEMTFVAARHETGGSEVVRYRCADGVVVVQSGEYPTLFHVEGLPALACTLAFWREQRGGPLERVLEVSP